MGGQQDVWTGDGRAERTTAKHCDKENRKGKSNENANVFKPRAIITTRSSELNDEKEVSEISQILVCLEINVSFALLFWGWAWPEMTGSLARPFIGFI